MKIKANITVEYSKEKYGEISYKTLELDNKGFVESKINKNKIEFSIQSNNLGSFLNTIDDLIVSEIVIEDILKDIK